ncbi:MAG: phage tail-like protein [Candidatus Latescibacterota bacterium]|jgi:phage tail-like protein
MTQNSNSPKEFYFELSADGEQTTFEAVDGMLTPVVLRNNLKAGDNPFKFRLPSMPKGNLNLKNGKANANSKLLQWASGQQLEEGVENPRRNVELRLKDASGKALLEWNFFDAKAANHQLDASERKSPTATIQNLELAYSYFTFTKK